MRVARIRAAVSRMSQLIDSTLNLARLESGQIACAPVPLDLGAHVSGICRRLEGLAPGFTIAIVLPSVPLVVPGDASLIDQIVTNLLSNAIKYSGDARRVEVTVGVDAEHAQVAVRDFGIGIPEAELDQIFGRFFRASTAKGLPGTGIGLELVRELVALHGGKVAVQSRVGEGSCFTVSLPLGSRGRDAAPPSRPAPQAARG
jgi:signal transduction histidine kinase